MNRQLVTIKRPHGCLVVLATGLLGALVFAAVSYVTYEPCLRDPDVAFDCLFDTRGVDTFLGACLGLFVGTCAGLLLLPFWPRVGRAEQRAERVQAEGDAYAWSVVFFIFIWLGALAIDVPVEIALGVSFVAAVGISWFVRRRGDREESVDETE